MVSIGWRNERVRVVGLRGHVKTRKPEAADENVDNSDWLAAAGIESFELSMPARDESLVTV